MITNEGEARESRQHDISWMHRKTDSGCAGRDCPVHDPVGGDLGAALPVLDRRAGPAGRRRDAADGRSPALVSPVTPAWGSPAWGSPGPGSAAQPAGRSAWSPIPRI